VPVRLSQSVLCCYMVNSIATVDGVVQHVILLHMTASHVPAHLPIHLRAAVCHHYGRIVYLQHY